MGLSSFAALHRRAVHAIADVVGLIGSLVEITCQGGPTSTGRHDAPPVDVVADDAGTVCW